MAMTRDRLLLFIAIALFVTLCFILLFNIRHLLLPQPSNSEFAEAISNQLPSLEKDGVPVFVIDSVSRHSNAWYIVTIKTKEDVDKFVPVKVIMKYSKNKPVTIIGPDTDFTDLTLSQHNTPQSIIEELRK